MELQEKKAFVGYVPSYKVGYSLIIGSYPFYILLKLFATIYERLLKAKSLVEQQIKLENGD